MGKNPKPTVEELEFVYGLMAKGYLDDASILAEYAQLFEAGTLNFPYRTDRRFVRERRKEFAAAKKVIPAQAASVDPIVVEARKKHFGLLTEVGKLLRQDLISLDQQAHPVWYSRFAKTRPIVEIQAEQWHGPAVFDAFRAHVQTPKLWQAYNELKEAMVANVEKAFAEKHVGSFQAHQSVDVSQVHVRIEVPNSYSDPLDEEGVHGVDFSFDLPESYGVAEDELNKLLLMGIVGGSCELCPGGAASTESVGPSD